MRAHVHPDITDRDKIVLTLYVRGMTKRQIAKETGVAVSTLHSTFSDLRDKLGVPKGVQLGQFILTQIPRDVIREYI